MTKPNSAAGSTSFLVAAIGIYVAYFLHGASVIALAQNMSALAEKFATDSAGIAYLISGIGLGRLVTILFFGALSDKFGRRSMILLGLVLYVLFFLGIPYSPNLTVAFILAFCVGAANSAIDTGGYPAMIECFPKASSSAVILLKAMVSFGQMLYPMCVSFLMVSGLWYGWAFIVPGAILIVLSLFIIKCRFPGTSGSGAAGADVPQMRAKPKMMLEGLVAVVFGVCAFSTFYVVAVWMPRYAAAFGGMTEAESLTTISYYSIGSLVCVFAFAYLLKSKVRSVWAMTLNGLIACVASAVLYLYPSPFVCTAGAFLIGFSAAGGILQLGVAVMAEFFPDSKGDLCLHDDGRPRELRHSARDGLPLADQHPLRDSARLRSRGSHLPLGHLPLQALLRGLPNSAQRSALGRTRRREQINPYRHLFQAKRLTNAALGRHRTPSSEACCQTPSATSNHLSIQEQSKWKLLLSMN